MRYASFARWSRLLMIGLLTMMTAIPLPLAAVQPATQRIAAPPVLPVPPAANPGDENWSAEFRYPGLNGKVAAILVAPNGDIYAGGRFSQADDAPAVGVARWDGANWHALGAGITGHDLNRTCCFDVNALALGPDGSLYVGGRFEKVGGVAANNIARWDGTAWHALGAGVSNPNTSDIFVSDIAVDGQGSVYVTGRFTLAGEIPVDQIARWDGSQWHAFSGLTGGASALEIGPDNTLYASGQFTPASGVTGRVGRWDGTNWHALGVGPGKSPSISFLDFDQAGSLYAGGAFADSVTGVPQNIARWDGTQWQNIGPGLPQLINAMAVAPDGTIYVNMNAQILRWDGAQWAALPGVFDTSIDDLETTADGTLYAAADFSRQTSKPLHIARWDDAGWQQLSAFSGQGLGGPVNDMLAAPDGSLYVAGDFWHAGAVKAAGVARWDGAAWHALGGLAGWVDALALGPDGSLYAGGEFRLGNAIPTLQVARWDGTQWQALGGEITDPNVGVITALAVTPDGAVYVAGFLGGKGFLSIGRWNGSAWQNVGGGLGSPDDGVVADLAIAPDGSLYAGGQFSVVNGVAVQAAVVRWDGTDWQAVDAAADRWSAVYQMEFHAGSLYAVGDTFTTASSAAGVARWDGAQWQPIPDSGLQGEYKYMFDLAFDQAGNLYVGGMFSQIGAQPARNIARWDGAQWHALGSGAHGTIRRLAVDGSGHLYAGGELTMAGGMGAGRIARWTAGDGRCGLTPDVPAIFYPGDQPVTVTVRTPGTLACLSVQRVDASHPHAPAALQTGAYWAIHGTDQAGAPATGAVFDLSLPRPAGSGDDDLACWLGLTWNCAADSRTPDAVTVAGATAFGIWARADAAVPGATWELSALSVDTSALTSTNILTYTLAVGTNVGGQYSATLDLHPALTLLAAPDMQADDQTLTASGVVSPGQMRPYVITVAVSPGFSGAITQTAHISGGVQDRTVSAPPVVVAGEAPVRVYLPFIRR